MPENIELPHTVYSVSTGYALDVTSSTAKLAGDVKLADSESKVSCGIIYGKSSTLSSTSGIKKYTTSSSNYSLYIFGLDANTTYYYRAFAVDAGEYKYGVVRSFSTLQSGAPEAIDLGLSVKWATCNVGADSPEDYGCYYAWGETEEKGEYYRDTYEYWNDTDGDGSVDNNEITNIGSNISGTSYDVAYVKWGGSWRMPTLDEIRELISNCSWEWTSVNGVSGQKVTGPNGNSIFLPAAGHRHGTEVHGRGSNGSYWSGTRGEGYGGDACYLDFNSGDWDWNNVYPRYYGFTVRSVTVYKGTK